jgi:hypothetical protein
MKYNLMDSDTYHSPRQVLEIASSVMDYARHSSGLMEKVDIAFDLLNFFVTEVSKISKHTEEMEKALIDANLFIKRYAITAPKDELIAITERTLKAIHNIK